MFNKGKLPSHWKISQITPIYKEGNKAEVKSYRAICLLCCAYKTLKVIFDENYSHCRHRLNANQTGFRKNRSATTQLLLFLDTVYRKFDTISSDDISIPYLDFAKAFDKVPHHLLIKKLESFDVGANIFLLLQSHLEDRKQIVKIGNCCSGLESVTIGVQQGSIPGPLLFLIFIKDLPDANPNTECFEFADNYKFIVHNQAKLDRSAKKN